MHDIGFIAPNVLVVFEKDGTPREFEMTAETMLILGCQFLKNGLSPSLSLPVLPSGTSGPLEVLEP